MRLTKNLAFLISFLFLVPIFTSNSIIAISTPDRPEGVSRGIISETYQYRPTNMYAEKVEFLFDWGDGTDSGWFFGYLANHSWNEYGQYNVKMKVRNPAEESEWSPVLDVIITRLGDVNNDNDVNNLDVSPFLDALQKTEEEYLYIYPDYNWRAADINKDLSVNFNDVALFNDIIESENEAPQTPTKPQGSKNGIVGQTYYFSSLAIEPDYEELSLKWDWGDGNFSEWGESVTSKSPVVESYSWEIPGDYDIRVKAIDNSGLESSWSDPLKIKISQPNPELEKFEINVESIIDENENFTVLVKNKNNGDLVQDATVEFNNIAKNTNSQGLVNFQSPDIDEDISFLIMITKEGFESFNIQIQVKNIVEKEPKGWIYGEVEKENGNVIDNANICIALTGEKISNCYFAENGLYSIYAPIGTYNMTISKPGFENANEKNVEVKKNMAVNKNFILIEMSPQKDIYEIGNNKDVVEATIEAGISSDKVGGEINLELVDNNYDIKLYQNLNITDVKLVDKQFTFQIDSEELSNTIVALRISNNIEFKDVKVYFDDEIIEKVRFVELLSLSEEENESKYARILTDDNVMYCLVYIPHFSYHTVTISSILKTDKVDNIILVILFFISCIVAIIIFLSRIFTHPVYINHFKKKIKRQ